MARSKSDAGPGSVRAFSAGGIVIRHTPQGAELVLGRRIRNGASAIWSLPKGTPDDGETPEQTALREVTEETGLEVRILESIGDIHYRFIRDGQRIQKTVHYYLMEPVGGSISDHDHEFEEVRWFALAEAESVMRFRTERDIVARALPVAGLD